MRATFGFLLQHGYSILIAWVFAEQIGLPIPSLPILLSAGALAGTGQLEFTIALASVVLASVVADLIWYQLGRRRGSAVLGFLCKISLEPDSCVSRTQSFYAKQGARSLVIAKFVPGLNTVAPPLAGITGMKLGKFVLWDTVGSLLWAAVFMGAGFIFSDQIEQVAEIFAGLREQLAVFLILMVSGYILFKYLVRKRLLRQLRTARVSVDELKRMLDRGEDPIILDLRSSSEYMAEPDVIPGAVHVQATDLQKTMDTLPKDKDVVLYCT